MAINRKGDYMEHIVQFAISIDDDKIKRNIENNVEKQVVNKIKGDCMKALVGKKSITNCDYTQKLKEMVDDNIQNFLARIKMKSSRLQPINCLKNYLEQKPSKK